MMIFRSLIVRLLLTASLLFCSFSALATEPVMISLREAIMIALRSNPEVQNGEIQRVVDKFSLRVAFWNFETHYSLTGSVGYNNTVAAGQRSQSNTQNLIPGASLLTPLGTTLAVQMANPTTDSTGANRTYNPAVSFSLTQPLMQGSGKEVVLAPLHRAENQEYLNRLNLKNTIINTVTAVISQYVLVEQAENSLKVQKLSLRSSLATLKQQEGFLRAGRIAPADLVQFQSTVASQRLQLEQQEVNLLQQKLQLLTLLGIEPTTLFKTSSNVKVDDEVLLPLNETIRLALLNNIPYQQALINLRQTKLQLLLAEDQQRWQLQLQATHTRGGGNGPPPNGGVTSLGNSLNYNNSVQLNLTVPIDNLSLQQQVVAAKIALQQAHISLAALKRQVQNNVINAYNTVLNQKEQIKQAKQAMELAQQSSNIAQAKLKYGKVTPFEVSSLQLNVTTQEISYINAIAAYVTNLATLDQTVGTTLDRWKIKLKY